jgi:hypothetical protein
LHERKLRVVVVTRQGHSDIRLAREEVSTLDIEKYIVAKVKELHIEHMLGDSDKTPWTINLFAFYCPLEKTLLKFKSRNLEFAFFLKRILSGGNLKAGG